MKTIKLKSIVLAFLAIGLVFTSCNKDEDDKDENTSSESTSDVKNSVEIDQASASIEELIVDVFDENKSSATPSGTSGKSEECATITASEEKNPRTITINFPSTGCNVNGHLFKGEIVMSFTYDSTVSQVIITYTLQDDFYFDDKQIKGTSVITNVFSNDNNNPQRTHNLDYIVTWPSTGITASRKGEIIIEWTEGSSTVDTSDNVFHFTGNWNDIYDSNTYSYNILTPLVRKGECDNYNFVSGSIDVQRPSFKGILDYGDGTCDKDATFTFEGGYEVKFLLK